MIRLKQKVNCCGCEACVQACPKKCITMEQDAEGFFYPTVDTGHCVECGLCETVCPILNRRKPEVTEPEAYAAYVKDEQVRQTSSSGGVFTALAQRVLDQKGVIFGAAFDGDHFVHHVKIETTEDLCMLRGSKYTQSRIGNMFWETKQVLREGRVVLFSGVSCQIAGLKSYLGREYDNLYTVDVLCHGVPSPKVWHRYCQERRQQYGSGISAVCFRDKRSGWKGYSVSMDFENGSQYCQKNDVDPFMRVFIADICLRPSCHSCRFKDIPRQSDLTIGDAWGIQNHMPEMDDDCGTSVVLVHTEKGRQLWEQAATELNVKQGQLDVLLPPSADSRRSVRKHPNRARFFAELDQGADMAQLVKLTKKPLLRRILSAGKRCLKRLKNAF